MSFELAEGYIDLTLDKQRFETGLALVRQKLAVFQQTLLQASAAARRMLLVAVPAFGFMVKSASDVEETVSKFEAVFKDQSEATKQYAADLAKTINRSKYDLMGYMATLQDTFVPLGFARDEAARLSEKVTALAEDLASFNNLRTDEVVAALQSALVGNHETVRKFGVVINEAALNQELLNMGIKGGTKNATEQQKAQARLNIIIRGTADAQGDAARTAGSFSNQMKGLHASVKDVAVEIGSSLIPSLTVVVDKIRSILQPVSEWVSKHKELTARIIYTTGAILAALAAIPLYSMAVSIATKAIVAMKAAVVALGVALAYLAANPLVAVAVALTSLAGYLIYTRIEGENFREKMVTVAENIAATWDWLKNKLANLFVPILPIWSAALTWIKNAFTTIGFVFKNFDDMATLGLLLATLGIVKFVNDVKYWFTDALPQYLTWLKQNWRNIFSDMLEYTAVVLENIGKNLKNFFVAVKDWLAGKGWNFQWTGLTEGFQKITEDLPKIMDRSLTPFEEGMKKEIDRLSEELGKKYADAFGEPPDVSWRSTLDNAPVDQAGTAAKAADVAAASSQAALGSKDTGKGVGFVGVSEMWKTLAGSLAVKDVDKQKLDVAKKQVDEQKKANQHLEKIAKNTEGNNYGAVGP